MMADILSKVFGRFDKRYRDMGDGSHAEVVAAVLVGAGGGSLGTITTVTATIANGESLSGVVDCGADRFCVGYDMPPTWTAAGISMRGGANPAALLEVQDSFGTLLAHAVTANQHVSLADKVQLYDCRYLQLRSGTAATPVAQGAERVITLYLASR
jgi:hypothetical protein